MAMQGSEDQQSQANVTNGTIITQENQKVTAANNIFKKRKVFNDPVHGHIALHPVCVRIIDTPQFQRLRHIKQLDACYLVYPGASHNRFEHSLGTCFLAGQLMKIIQERQPDEEITERDILCVEIAGLCHDLGQGPFSHVFEKRFMPRMRKQFSIKTKADGVRKLGFCLKHEETAKKMFEYMLEDNNRELEKDMQRIIGDCKIPGFNKFEEKDFLFIKEMIDKPRDLKSVEWPYSGRDEAKSFMYEIVANKRNGIDVDKWDYLARDSYMLGMKVNFDHGRCFMSARVLRCNGLNETNGTNGTNESIDTPLDSTESRSSDTNESNATSRGASVNEDNASSTRRNVSIDRKQICYREKDAGDLYDMFYTRMTLHRRAYKHKTHRIIGMMICDALLAANDTIKFIGKNGIKYRISDTVDDMKAYTQLTDDVFQIILYSQADPEVLQSSDVQEKSSNVSSSIYERETTESEETSARKRFLDAKEILNKILKRKLYKCITQTQIKEDKFDEMEFKHYMKIRERPVEETFFDYDVVELDYGMKNIDPMANVGFYSKEDYETPIKLKRTQVSYVLPDTFAENILRIYSKGTNISTEQEMIKNFENWCKEKQIPLPKRSRLETTVPKRLYASETNTQQVTPPSESNSNPSSEEENLEDKHIPEPNTVTPYEEPVEETPPEDIGGVEVRSRDEQPSDQ